jgi:putative SOS response-associated peptidase YedK
MCGRFTLSHSPEAIAQSFGLSALPTLTPRYNIAPTQPVPVVRVMPERSEREFTYLTWGLIPSWAKDPKMGAKLINARSETLAEKPSFRTALKRRRCLVVADGFYEWQRSPNGKQPFFIGLQDHQPFGLAGLWEHWQSADGSEIESCTIITTEANELMRPIHDRMPVILRPEHYDRWLDPHVESGVQSLLTSYAAEAMIAYPVSSAVNNPRHDAPDCVAPQVLPQTPGAIDPAAPPQNSQ